MTIQGSAEARARMTNAKEDTLSVDSILSQGNPEGGGNKTNT